MNADEREIYYFLKSWKDQFISAREIARRAGGKRRAQYEPEWAKPVLLNMVERGILESDAAGHYRIRPVPPNTKLKRWVSPQIARILKSRSKEMGEIVMSESDIDDYYEHL
jgi:hypothetical protein